VRGEHPAAPVIGWRQPSLQRNVLLNWLSAGANLAYSLVVTPLVVRGMGHEAYGVWSFLNGLTMYSSLLYLGVSSSFIKRLAELRSGGGAEAASRLASVALSLYSAIGSFCVLVAVAAAPHVSSLFATPLPEPVAVSAAITCVLLGFRLLFLFVGSTYGGLLTALERVDLNGVVQLASTVLRAAGVPLALQSRDPLVAFALLMGSTACLEVVAQRRLARVLWPALKARLVVPTGAELKALYTFGLQAFFLNVATLLISYADTAVVGILLGASSVTLYALPLQLIEYGRILVNGITHPMLPRLARLKAEGDDVQMRHEYLRVMRLCGVVAACVNVNLVILGPDFLTLWVGADFGSASRPLLLLLGPAAVAQAVSTQAQTPFFLVLGAFRFSVATLLCEAMANLALSLWLAGSIGLTGVAAGTLIPAVGITLWLLPSYLCRQFGATWAVFRRDVARPILAAAFFNVVLQQALSAWLPVRSYLELILRAALSLAPALLTVATTFPAGEREQLWAILRRMGGRRSASD
jgi:O-antigen/teichoic acid export membrane protein